MFQSDFVQQDAFQIGEAGGGASADVPNTAQLSTIEMGQVAITAAGLGGVIQE
jgi:hypothetical protein